MELLARAGKPRLLLLDETLAGLGHGEAEEVVAVAQRLPRDGVTIAMPAVRPSNEVRRPRSPWPATRGRLDACRTGRPGGQAQDMPSRALRAGIAQWIPHGDSCLPNVMPSRTCEHAVARAQLHEIVRCP